MTAPESPLDGSAHPSRSEAAILAAARRCTLCGACRTGCPTHDVTLHEGHSGRGRVIMALGFLEGVLGEEGDVRSFLSACTRCGFCEEVCPLDVPVVPLIAMTLERLGAEPAKEKEPDPSPLLEVLEERLAGSRWPAEIEGPVGIHLGCGRASAGTSTGRLERILQRAGARTAPVSLPRSCGASSKTPSEEGDMAARLGEAFRAALERAGIRVLLTHDQSCGRWLLERGGISGTPRILTLEDLLRQVDEC